MDGAVRFEDPSVLYTNRTAEDKPTTKPADVKSDFEKYLDKSSIGNGVSLELRERTWSPDLYYLHGDHLGTATFVTNSQSETTQFFLNLPFGETMIEQMDGSYDNPFKFNAKELDEDTGLYYYGARYYNPRLSIWYGVDPLAEKMPSWSPYAYAFDNPIIYTDPTGMAPEHVDPSAIFEKNKNGSYKNPQLVKSWNQFATSKEGVAYLSDYAIQGQVIAGVKYDNAGKYDKAGVDLSFDSGQALVSRNEKTNLDQAVGITSISVKNGRVNFKVSIQDRAYTDLTLETLTHELGIHVKLGSMDYFDNKKFDFSKGYESIAKDGYTSSYLNKYYGEKSRRGTNVPDHLVDKKTNQAYNLGAPILRSFYQKLNIKKTDAQIKSLYK